MSLPTSPPTSPREPRDTELLLQFLHERDHDCPRCGYNLRNLTQPVCPECREELVLKVGASKVQVWPLLVTLAPGFFCAIVVGIVMVGSVRWGPPPFRGEDWLLVAFLLTSAAVAIGLAVRSKWFMRQALSVQLAWGASIWAAHVLTLIIAMTR